MTTLAVSDKCIPEWLSKSCSLQDWGLVYWETAWLSGVKSGVLCHSSSVLLCTRSALESKSHQQLDRRLAATVWAARHHSNAPLTFTSSCMNWKPHQCTSAWRHRLKLKRRNMFIRNRRGMSMSWNGIWLKYYQQPAVLHWSIDRSVTWSFYCVSQSQKQILWTFAMTFSLWYVTVMTFKAYTTAVMNKLTRFVSQGRVRTAVRRSGQLCSSFVANLLKYLCAKN